jgi:hypothetical protein
MTVSTWLQKASKLHQACASEQHTGNGDGRISTTQATALQELQRAIGSDHSRHQVTYNEARKSLDKMFVMVKAGQKTPPLTPDRGLMSFLNIEELNSLEELADVEDTEPVENSDDLDGATVYGYYVRIRGTAPNGNDIVTSWHRYYLGHSHGIPPSGSGLRDANNEFDAIVHNAGLTMAQMSNVGQETKSKKGG